MVKTSFIRLALCATACILPALACAQNYPARPITIIVAQPPGGNNDIVARSFGQKLSERLGQPVLVDNMPGAGGTIGLTAAARSANDGYTITIGDMGGMVISKHTQQKLAYDTLKDFAPIYKAATVSILIAVNNDSKFQNFGQIIEFAKANPGKIAYGTGGIGVAGHLAIELLQSTTKAEMLHIPFKGGAAAFTGMMGKQVDFAIDGAGLALAKAGTVKPLAVTGPRLAVLPDTPSLSESLKGFEFTNWFAFFAPAGTPPAIVEKLNQEFKAISEMPDIRAKLESLGLIVQAPHSAQQFSDSLRADVDRIAKIVKDANLKFD